ncbi:hypothetical protein [Burkholderia ubonensis]|nr:hypothetical protein [Burkholderia ubonensis]VWB74225.1 hypothetical protein BUB20358_03482 [Burkholderia ubonensis]
MQGETAVKTFGIPHEAVASLDEAVALAARLTDADGAASPVRPA